MANQNAKTTDEVLQFVLKNFITLHDDDKKYYVKHYSAVIEKIIALMNENDKLFQAIFSRMCFAGSYYDGLKVGKPEEFDLDVVMRLPVNEERDVVVNSEEVDPPFTTVRVQAMEQLKHHPKWPYYRKMDSWTDRDGYLLQSGFLNWMESVVSRTLNGLPNQGNARQLQLNGDTYLVTFRKTGPAMTFNITMPNGTKVDVDFVPVIEFQRWPAAPVRGNPSPSRRSWFIVPKPNSKRAGVYNERYWRMAFHDQERDLLNGRDRLKPVCRLLKKLRDNNTTLERIASYYLKTLFLWDILARKDDLYYSRTSLTICFTNMLVMLRDHLKQGQIKYYWDERYDLLSGMSPIEKNNCLGRLNNIIKDIETKSSDNPLIIAKYLLTPEEYKKVEQYSNEKRSSPPLATSGNNHIENLAERMANVTANSQQPAAQHEGSMEMVVRLLTEVNQQLMEQKKVTQRVLGRLSVLQTTVDLLVDENAALREDLKLAKLRSVPSLLSDDGAFQLRNWEDPLIDFESNDQNTSLSPLPNEIVTADCCSASLELNGQHH